MQLTPVEIILEGRDASTHVRMDVTTPEHAFLARLVERVNRNARDDAPTMRVERKRLSPWTRD